MSRYALLLLACFCAAAVAETPRSPDPDAAAFMRETLAAYRAMSSYRDRGHLVQSLKSSPDDPDNSAITQDFVTLFKRPDTFKFAWTTIDNFSGSGRDQDAIWSDGTTVWASWSSQDDNAVKVLEDFGTAVASAGGVSHGAAHDIFVLLSERVGGSRLDRLTQPTIVRSESLNGVDCYVVRGHAYENVQDVWIGKQDHLIRKLTDTRRDGAVMTVERTGIAVDQDIPAAEFSWHKQ